MSPFLMILLVLLVVYFISRKKQQKTNKQAAAQEPPHEPLHVTLEQGCWSCTPEELLDDLSWIILRTKSTALPVYVFGQGYEVRDVRHWVTLLTAPDGKLAEAVITWGPDGQQNIRQAASYYAGGLLNILAEGESEAMIKEINALITNHKAGEREELVKLSAMSRVYVLMVDEPQRTVTVRITPVLQEMPIREPQTGDDESCADQTDPVQPEPCADRTDPVQAEPEPSANDPAGEAEDTKE